MSEQLYRIALLMALVVIAMALWSIAQVNALDFIDRRMIPPPVRVPDPADDA